MNIRLGIYEIFSRIVPGGLYIFVIGQLFVILGVVVPDWQVLRELSLVWSLGIIAVAYVFGEMFDRFALAWFRVFCKKGYHSIALANFKQWYVDKWVIDFKDTEWHILLAYIRTKNIALTDEIERHNAISIMLRNVSLGLLFLAINFFVGYFLFRETYYVIAGVISVVFAIFIVLDAVKFHQWFFNSIYDTILAYRLDLEERIKPVKKNRRKTDAK